MKNNIIFLCTVLMTTLPAVSAPFSPVGAVEDLNYKVDAQIQALRSNKKVITINDTKVAQFGILKNQLVFEAQLPRNINEEKMYELMNGLEIVFKAVPNDQDSSKLNIICYRIVITPSHFNAVNGNLAFVPTRAVKKEFVTITLPKADLEKKFFIGTTNNALSIFQREGNDIIKTTLIPKMIE